MNQPFHSRRALPLAALLLCCGIVLSTMPRSLAFTPDNSHLRDREHIEALQRDAFRYAIEHADPESGLVFESSYHVNPLPIAVGGTGFGVAAIVVAAERGWLPRQEAAERVLRMSRFLRDRTERASYHGAFPHWLDPKTGQTVPFGPRDKGADIVETSLLMQGLLIARSYFDRDGDEAELRRVVTELWEDVDWNHFAGGSEEGLYWHWDPDRGFHHGMKVQGFNECLVTYVLAMSSPTHPITRKTFDYWLDGENYRTRDVFGYRVEGAPEGGGPLFLTQYSFIGIDPSRIADRRVEDGYFIRAVKQTLSNRNYCLHHAPDGNGYGEDFWGLTAGLTDKGYRANSPTEDFGVLTPTAALSSLPFTPAQSLAVLRRLRDAAGDGKTWGEFGPYDGMRADADGRTKWVAREYLAINQLPMVAMAENYRSGLMWRLFMSDADIAAGLERAGLRPPALPDGFPEAVPTKIPDADGGYVALAHEAARHPDSGLYRIPFRLSDGGAATFVFRNNRGAEIHRERIPVQPGANVLAFAPFAGSGDGVLTLVMRPDSGGEHSLPVRLL